MATKFKLNDCVPCIAIHPGEIIKDELDAREMKQKELASFMGMPTSVLNDIIKGRRAITPGCCFVTGNFKYRRFLLVIITKSI